MRPSSNRPKREEASSDYTLALSGADLLLSMVEARHAGKNGDVRRMDSQLKTQQELEKIGEQLAKLEALPGQDEQTREQIQLLHQRIHSLETQLAVPSATWQKIELARHAQRPHTLDYIDRIFTDWSEIHGDRGFGDDPAMVCGMARLRGEEVMVIGTEKGRDTKQRVYRNFGLPNPEGYRKALRAMKVAEKFRRPIITLVDVTGANPGVGAEERGQAEAIARNLRDMSRLEVPIVTAITGEGGSGGALAIAVADRVLMMENAMYSVISPEACAAIMWRDAGKKVLAAEALHITAPDLSRFGCIDEIVPEPEGGAHVDPVAASEILSESISKHLAQLKAKPVKELIASRYDKFRKMAQFFEVIA